jgi:hypothetical protein
MFGFDRIGEFQRKRFSLFAMNFFRLPINLQATCQAVIHCLEKVNPTFARAPRHEAVSKRVMITKRNKKGYTGYVQAYNYVLQTFLVDVISVGKSNFGINDIVYE